MVSSLLIPTVVLMGLAVLVTRLVERVMPETMLGLALTALVASGVLWALAGGLFGWLYLSRAPELAPILGAGSGLRHLAGLGAKAALIWLPLVLITVATAPRRWKTNVW